LYLYDEISLVIIEDWDDYGGRILAVSNERMRRYTNGNAGTTIKFPTLMMTRDSK